MAAASLLSMLLRNPKVWKQVALALPLIKDGAEFLYRGTKVVVDDLRERGKRGAAESARAGQKSEVELVRAELATEMEKVEGRILEHAELVTKMADQLALLATLIRVNQFRSLLGLCLGGAALAVSVVAVVTTLAR